MKILAIECTHGFASVAVRSEGRVVERRLAEWQKTAESLVPLVMKAMDATGLSVTELDGVAVSSGPGSFTALRIGLSVAKGVAFGADLPLVPVSTLLAMVEAAKENVAAKYIVPVIPSRADEYFYSIFSSEDGELIELESSRCMISELPGKLAGFTENLAIVSRSADVLAEAEPSLAPHLNGASFFGASSLLGYAEKALSAGFGGTVAGTEPDYRQAFAPVQRDG